MQTNSRKAGSKPKSATEIDRVLGRKLRGLRHKKGVSQAELAAACGISFQQVQKYENGTNRVTVARLAQIAAVFEVSLGDVVSDLPLASVKRLSTV